jgi:hypothetical protein
MMRNLSQFCLKFAAATIAAFLAEDCLAQKEYYPLSRGNQWVYRARGPAGAAYLAEVTSDTESIGNAVYSVVEGLPGGTVRLRVREDGMLVAYDAEARQERVWAAFGAPERSVYQPEFDTCTGAGTVVSRSASYHGQLGDSESGLRVAFAPGKCADAGRQEELYLPYIGSTGWTESTIAGPRTFDLVYARIGGVTVLSAPEAAFGVSMNSGADGWMARISLRHTLPQPLRLTFRSAQTFDLVIRDAKNAIVYQWSRGRIFAASVREAVFAPGEKNWIVVGPRAPLAQGTYTAEATLETVESRLYTAKTAFDVP